MSRLLISDGTGRWRAPAMLHAMGKHGFTRVDALHEAQDSDWVTHWRSDHAQPKPPTITAIITPGTRNSLDITVDNPQDNIRRLVVEANGLARYPWSEWDTKGGRKQLTDLPYGEDVLLTAKTQDVFGTWSDPASLTARTLAQSALPAGVNHYTTYVPMGEGDSLDLYTHLWLHQGDPPMNGARQWARGSANKYLWQGGAGRAQWVTFMCFPGAKEVFDYAGGVTNVTLRLWRRANDSSNIVGGQRVDDADTDGTPEVMLRLFKHDLMSLPVRYTRELQPLHGDTGAELRTGPWAPGAGLGIPLPQALWGTGIAVWDGGMSKAPVSTSKWDASFVCAGLQIDWWSLRGNPWP